MTLAKQFAEVLNTAWKEDPECIQSLLERRVAANGLGDATPLIVRGFPPEQTISALGLLNGLLSAVDGGKVAACYDEAGTLLGFQEAP